MRTINYILNGFGFVNWNDFYKSSFGFILNSQKVVKADILLAFFISTVEFLFGFNHLFWMAYVVLLLFEWFTGVKASQKRGEKHESRKFGRMLLKIATYMTPLYILNTFAQNASFPIIMGYEIDPFTYLYWAVLLGIIWQLMVSLLENLECLGFRFASMLIKIINKKFYEKFDLNDERDCPL